MKSFEYAAPNSLKEATSLLDESWGQTEVLAGGMDLLTSLKQLIVAPKRLVSLRNIKDLRGIHAESKSLRIGATTTLAELAMDKNVQKHFPSLVTAARGVGSAQMLNRGTVGGDLCQRPRCWYYRNGFGLLAQQNGESLVLKGDNRYHAIFGNQGPAYFVSASSLGPPLIALGATIVAVGRDDKRRQIPAAKFFKTPKTEQERETVLEPTEIIQEIQIPLRGLKNATYEVRHRHGLDWPYVTASVAFSLSGGNASDAQIVLGHVAPTPWISSSAAGALDGRVDASLAAKCGAAAMQGAKPLSKNGYKVPLVRAAVRRAVLSAAEIKEA